MDDQAKMQMPRIETMGLFKAAEEKLQALVTANDAKLVDIVKNAEGRLESFKTYYEKDHDDMAKQLAALRASQSEWLGRAGQASEERAQKNWIVGAVISFVSLLLAIGAAVVALRR